LKKLGIYSKVARLKYAIAWLLNELRPKCYFCGEPMTLEDIAKNKFSIHHKNHNRDNNAQENLRLCHRSCHRRYHRNLEVAKNEQEKREIYANL
jgi:hypothetical protein